MIGSVHCTLYFRQVILISPLLLMYEHCSKIVLEHLIPCGRNSMILLMSPPPSHTHTSHCISNVTGISWSLYQLFVKILVPASSNIPLFSVSLSLDAPQPFPSYALQSKPQDSYGNLYWRVIFEPPPPPFFPTLATAAKDVLLFKRHYARTAIESDATI